MASSDETLIEDAVRALLVSRQAHNLADENGTGPFIQVLAAAVFMAIRQERNG